MHAGLGQRCLLSVGALEARQLFVFETVDFGFSEGELVLESFSLCGRGDVVALRAQALGALAVLRDVALEPRAQGLFAGETVGDGGGLGLRLVQGRFGLGNFGGKCARGLCEAGSFEVDGLELDQLLDQRIHGWIEV
jgi:hypothetical protein